MAATTFVESLSEVMREELSMMRQDTAPEVDGIFSRMYTSSRGVSKGIGRDFKVKHVFSTGVAGAFKNVNRFGPSTVDVDYTPQSYMYDSTTLRTYPTIGETTQLGYVTKVIDLVQGLGNFHVPLHMMAADELDAEISDAVSRMIKAVAKNVNQNEANSFYQTGRHKIVEITTAASALADITGEAVRCTLDGANAVGRIAQIMPGMTFDLYDSSYQKKNIDTTGTPASNTPLVVGAVDYIGKTFDLYTADGTAFDVADHANGDFYSYRDADLNAATAQAAATRRGPSGLEYWIVDSGTDVFGLNLTTYPQFKSLVTAVAGALTEEILNQNVGQFFDAYGAMYSVDSLISTTGVLTKYMSTIDGLYRYDRNNKRLTLHEGWSSFDYAWQGQTFEYLASRYCRKGYLYALKLRDQNLTRYVPPQVAGSKTQSSFSGDIQFTAPLMGSSNIFLPGRNSNSALVEHNEAPFTCFREWCPNQLPGIKLTGLVESPA
jgi:hypothetical protein